MTAHERPLIGVNGLLVPGDSPALKLANRYANAVLKAGGLPVAISPLGGLLDVERLVARVDGLLLTDKVCEIGPGRLRPGGGSVRPGGLLATDGGSVRPGGLLAIDGGSVRPGGVLATDGGIVRPGGVLVTDGGRLRPDGVTATWIDGVSSSSSSTSSMPNEELRAY